MSTSCAPSRKQANALALAAVALWASLATLGVSLAHVPPFLLTGLALVMGSVVALPLSRFDLRLWRLPPVTLALGIYGLFGYHFLLFTAFRLAPPVQANLVNYLWPLGIVLMAPLLLPGVRLRAGHVLAALMGFVGAALVILGGSPRAAAAADPLTGGWAALDARTLWGYGAALGAAFIWSSYSLLTRRVPAFPTAAIGLLCLVSGLLSLLCHVLLEPATALTLRDAGLLALIGLGPLGAAFFLWDAALKRGDARQIGILSFLTPLLSTLLLLGVRGERPGPAVLAAGALIVAAAVLGARSSR